MRFYEDLFVVLNVYLGVKVLFACRIDELWHLT